MSNVIIIGAGIGGLSLALELHFRGHHCHVYEAAPEIKAVGVGINIQTYAARELHRLGLASKLAEAAMQPLAIAYANSTGQIMFREPLGVNAGCPVPQYSIHRAALHRILLEAVAERLGPDAIHLGHKCIGFNQNNLSVTALFDGDNRSVTGDILVGCDGIHSAIHHQLYPATESIRHAGVMMWRGITRGISLLDHRTMVRSGRVETGKLVAYPVRDPDQPEEIMVNWVAELQSNAYPTQDTYRLVEMSSVPDVFLNWKFDWMDGSALVRNAEFILQLPMSDRDPLPRWSHDRVTLLGDAAHPMYPVGSNGAGQAIVDASVLAACIDTVDDEIAALIAYDDLRRPLTADVVRRDREGGPDVILDAIHALTNSEHLTRETAALSNEQQIAALLRDYQTGIGLQGSTASRRSQGLPDN
jgi:5-methylphenazine-1-carboxylate 1-monooxygenase